MKLQAMSEPVIFLIEEDDETRPALRKTLKTKGYNLVLAIDEEDALERITGDRVQADLILINLLSKKPEEVLEIGRKIKREANLEAPLVVIAEKFGLELEGRNINMDGNEYITYLEDTEQLFDLLSQLTVKAV